MNWIKQRQVFDVSIPVMCSGKTDWWGGFLMNVTSHLPLTFVTPHFVNFRKSISNLHIQHLFFLYLSFSVLSSHSFLKTLFFTLTLFLSDSLFFSVSVFLFSCCSFSPYLSFYYSLYLFLLSLFSFSLFLLSLSLYILTPSLSLFLLSFSFCLSLFLHFRILLEAG